MGVEGTLTAKAYYVKDLNLVRVFNFDECLHKALSNKARGLLSHNTVLGCIEFPGTEIGILSGAAQVQFSESLSHYIDELGGILEHVDVPGEDYWQSLLNNITLRPFQIEYLQWMESRRLQAFPPKGSQVGFILSLDQGLGKTITALVADQHFRKVGLVKKTFVVCRNNNKFSTWVQHVEDYTKLTCVVIEGNKQKRLKGFKAYAKADVGIIHYEAARLHAGELSSNIDHAIIDEAQKVANHTSKQSKTINTMAKKAAVTSLLSGGIAQNRLATQLWHPLNLCDRKKWPSFEVWKRDWCVLEELWVPLYVKGRKILDPKTRQPVRRRIFNVAGIKNRAELSRRIATYIFQKSKRDVSDQLPPKIHQVIETRLHPAQLKLYRQVRDDVENQVKGVSVPTALTKTLRLLQVCATLDCFDMGDISRKADDTAEIMYDIVPDDGKALVFSQFVPMCNATYKRLLNVGARALLLTGKVGTSAEKDVIRERFREGDEQFLVTTIQLEGEGGSYPKAPFVFRLDRVHPPLRNLQCEDRAHRLTSDYDVLNIIDFVTRDSIEEKQMEILKEKMKDITDIMSLANVYTMGDIISMLSVVPKAD